jgi:NAD(P)-dependent dehydrogenase (short-subunit alcohol dehydrogenase family)
MRFTNKTLLVTGGSQGIGLEVALSAAREGARVVVCGRAEDKGRLAVETAAREDLQLDFLACDVQDDGSVARLLAAVVERYGKLDLAFNNAGITAEHAKLGDSSIDNWRKVIDINLTGTYLSMKYEIAAMLQSGGGAIVNTSSAAGVMAISGQAAYVASKAAIIGLTQSAAIDYANAANGAQIRINAVAPGPIAGGMNHEKNLAENPARTERKIASTAMRRFGSGAEVAQTVLWLLSSHSSYITGAVIPVDGGYAAGKF